jgi:signal transduction histidine kinase/DNA-binding response OmpR family regulator
MNAITLALVNQHSTAPAPLSVEGRDTFVVALIAGSSACVFAADLFTPLGIAVWVLYLTPLLISFQLRRPVGPLAAAAVCTLLMALGYFLSPGGVSLTTAVVNRSLGIVTVWIMAAAARLFIINKLAIEQQEWLQSGQVRLSERLAGEQEIAELANAVLREMVSATGAQVGTVYARNGADLHLCASFAVPSESNLPHVIETGKGALGAAIQTGLPQIIRGLSETYLRYGSALGSDTPRVIIAAPLLADGDPVAAIELGFSSEPHEAAVNFLERAGGAVGVAFRSAEFRARLSELLEDTRRLAEELQRQSEELRTSNEELEEQSQALQASQARLESQQRDLEAANLELEERANALETERAAAERTGALLRAQTSELQQVSRYKSEFLANMSHELRTPLNSSLILARLLADNKGGNLNEEQVRFAETIESAGNDLLTLINDILDLSKIEAGQVDVRPERVALDTILNRLDRTFQPVAREKGLDLRIDLASDAPAELTVDPQRLEQVLRNFLSNALKFTERGEVALTVSAAPGERIALCVTDTGIGIAPEHQQTVFEAFRQADGTTSRRFGGTGLGLSISRELARLLGGTIALESEPGRGSSFTLLLPLVYDEGRAPARTDQVVSSAARPRSGLGAEPPLHPANDDRDVLTGDARVLLIVEDDDAFAAILVDLAHERGFQCLLARTADEGVALARQYLPHAIVLDLGLPDHTGMTVLDRLKHNVRTRHIPVHVISGHDHVESALARGAVGYVLKPAGRTELVNTLSGFEARLDRKLRRILLVEDDAAQREAVGRLLELEDVETVAVASGEECLALLAETTFDCMVLDLTLADMTGFELLDLLSADESRSFPPVIVYTGRELTQDEELLLRRYSRSVILKGARSPERLLDEITLFLHQVVSDLPNDVQRTLTRAISRDGAIEGRRILVVEDDVRNVFSITSIFEPQGAEVMIARNGQEALDLLATAEAGGALPDLLLMDVMMPVMDGLTATREIRKRETCRELPIIMLTAKAMAEDHRECLAAGANDYMTKPLDIEKLLSLVRVWLPRG